MTESKSVALPFGYAPAIRIEQTSRDGELPIINCRVASIAASKAVAIVRPPIVDRGAGRDDTVGADRAGLAEYAALHAVDVADIRDPRRLIKVAKIVRQVRILVEAADVAFVADIVAGIETHQARKQAPVRLGLGLAAQIALPRQPLLEAAQCLEQKLDGAVVSRLRDRVAATVDGVVHAFEDQRIRCVDFGTQRRGIVVGRRRRDG
jgi:hypothetical protein